MRPLLSWTPEQERQDPSSGGDTTVCPPKQSAQLCPLGQFSFVVHVRSFLEPLEHVPDTLIVVPGQSWSFEHDVAPSACTPGDYPWTPVRGSLVNKLVNGKWDVL